MCLVSLALLFALNWYGLSCGNVLSLLVVRELQVTGMFWL
jgi:hypothetical protein